MIKISKATIRDTLSDNIEYTLKQLHKLHLGWKFSHTKGAHNYYVLMVGD